MTEDRRDWHDIASKAGTLPDERFLKVVRLFEQVRKQPGVEKAMEILRPRLSTLKPPRRITAERLFFLPVEDLLDDADRYRRRQSRISRAALAPCWRALKSSLASAVLEAATTELAALNRPDSKTLIELGAPLWEQGSAALVTEIEKAQGNLKLAVKIFGRDDDIIRQAQLIANVTRIGRNIQSLKFALPLRPIDGLGEFHADAIRNAVASLTQPRGGLQDASTLLLVLAARMMRPGDLLVLLSDMQLPCGQEDKLALIQDVGIAAVENILHQSGEWPTVPPTVDKAGEIALMAERLVGGLDSLRNQLSNDDRKKVSARMEAARLAVTASVRQAVIDPAVGTLLGPTRDMAASLRSGDPKAAERDSLQRAEEFALAFRRTSQIAPLLGLKSEVEAKAMQVCREARSLAEALSSTAVGRDGTWQLDPAILDSQIVSLLRLVELIAGPSEADAILMNWEQRLAAAPFLASR